MIEIKRTTAENQHFVDLVQELDAYLKETDGDEHDFYNQFNGIGNIKYCVVSYWNKEAIGCGAIKQFDDSSMEIKRMFVRPKYRGKGIADSIITEFEDWAMDLNYEKCILETGNRQVEAVRFYQRMGYQRIPNYGQYKGIANSNCFEKRLV